MDPIIEGDRHYCGIEIVDVIKRVLEQQFLAHPLPRAADLRDGPILIGGIGVTIDGVDAASVQESMSARRHIKISLEGCLLRRDEELDRPLPYEALQRVCPLHA